MYLSPFIIVIQQNGGLAASICLGLIVIVTIATTAVTSMCFWRARAALSRSAQHHQQNNSRDHQDHELTTQARPVKMPTAMPGSNGNLSLFCNEAYEQIPGMKSSDMYQEDNTCERLPDLDMIFAHTCNCSIHVHVYHSHYTMMHVA